MFGKFSKRNIKASLMQDKILEEIYSDKIYKKWLKINMEDLKGIYDFGLTLNPIIEKEVRMMFLHSKIRKSKTSFEDFCKNIFNKLINDFLKRSENIVDKNTLVVYRAIVINSLDQFINAIKTKRNTAFGSGLGIYWSFDKKKTEAWEGTGTGPEIIITAEINPENINFSEMVMANVHVEYGNLESEVTLNAGTQLKIINIEFSESGKSIKLDYPLYFNA